MLLTFKKQGFAKLYLLDVSELFIDNKLMSANLYPDRCYTCMCVRVRSCACACGGCHGYTSVCVCVSLRIRSCACGEVYCLLSARGLCL